MFSEFYTTNNGQKYISKAMTGKTLVLTKGQYGEGIASKPSVIPAMTALISPIADMPISKRSSAENCVTTTTQFTNVVNGNVHTPFYFMEAGLFGKVINADGTEDAEYPETLLFYANALSKEKADYIPEVLTEFIMNWPLTISQSANVAVVINESLVYPTMKDLNGFKPAIATEAEAKAATDDTKMMTPYKVSVYVDKVLGDVNTLLDSINGKVV